MIKIPLSTLPFILGIIAFLLWASRIEPPLPLWIMVLVPAAALLFMVLSFLAFDRVRVERDEARYKEFANMKSGDVIKGKDINVSLMFQRFNSSVLRKSEERNILDNVTFDHCELRGPCLVTLMGEWYISDCKFFGKGILLANIPLEQAKEGLGKFIHCRFTSCSFHNMCFYLSGKDYQEFDKIVKA